MSHNMTSSTFCQGLWYLSTLGENDSNQYLYLQLSEEFNTNRTNDLSHDYELQKNILVFSAVNLYLTNIRSKTCHRQSL